MRSRVAVALVAAATAAYARESSAQVGRAGWALDRYEPAPSGDAFFFAEHPWYRRTRLVAVGLQFDYAMNPLSLEVTRAGQSPEVLNVVSGMFTGHLGVAWAPLDRLSLHASLPVAFSQSGTDANAMAVTASPSVAAGDVRVGVRVRLFGDAERDGFSLHLGALLWLPTGSPDHNTGDGRVRVEPRLTLAGRASALRWSFGVGFQVRGDVDAFNLAVGNELKVTAAVGVVVLDDRLQVGPEAYVFTSVRDLPNGGGSAAFAGDQWGAELMLGARFLLAQVVQVGVGGGVGVAEGYGVPAARGMFSIAYAPSQRATREVAPRVVIADVDSDGVPDASDLCPTIPRGAHPDRLRAGCPLADTDGDGVFDDEDQCPTVGQGERPDPSRRGCPIVDRDGDGVFDDEDQCVDVAAGRRPSTARAGCPAPDADHDNIIDAPEGPDRCPDRPETFNGVDDEDGCPDGVTLAATSGDQVRIYQQVRFRTNRDEIVGRQSFLVLDSVVAILRAVPDLTLEVQGHTDYRGSAEHNQQLSNRRALSVQRYLVAHGVTESRLAAYGFGNTCPAQPGTNRAARRANRRVQFVITAPGATPGRCVRPAE